MDTNIENGMFLRDDYYPEINFEVILDAADGWFDEWTQFYQLAFEEACRQYSRPKFQHAVPRPAKGRAFTDLEILSGLSRLLLVCMNWTPERVREKLLNYDRETQALANYLLGPKMLYYACLQERQEEIRRKVEPLKFQENLPDEKTSTWLEDETSMEEGDDSPSSSGRNDGDSISSRFSENALFDVLRKNLDRYAQQKLKKSNDTMSQQAALQLFRSLENASETGIRQTIDWLLGTIGRYNPKDEPVDLLWESHNEADEEYRRKNDEYSKYCARSGKETQIYQKYARKQLKNAYYRLFCPLRDVDVLYRLLHLSKDKAYQYPSRYRRKFLQNVLLPEFKKKLDQWENTED